MRQNMRSRLITCKSNKCNSHSLTPEPRPNLHFFHAPDFWEVLYSPYVAESNLQAHGKGQNQVNLYQTEPSLQGT